VQAMLPVGFPFHQFNATEARYDVTFDLLYHFILTLKSWTWGCSSLRMTMDLAASVCPHHRHGAVQVSA